MSSALATVPPQSVTQEDWAELRRLFSSAVAKNASPALVDLSIAICRDMGFHPLANHINLIDGQVYVTHKGLLHAAHRSGQFDGLVLVEQGETDAHYTATVSVYRKDMRHPFTYPGRYPKDGRNKQYGPEMAITRAECMALRRAFDVSLGVQEEINWQGEAEQPTDQSDYTVTQAADDAAPTPLRALPAPAPVDAPAPVVMPPEFAATPMPDDEFVALESLLVGMVDDGIAESEIVREMQGYKPKVSQSQFRQLRVKYAQLVNARKAAPAPPAEGDDFGDVVGPPAATPAPAERVGTKQVAKIEAIKAMCAMKHIPLAEVEGQAIARWSVEDLALLTPAQADELLGELQRANLREPAGATR